MTQHLAIKYVPDLGIMTPTKNLLHGEYLEIPKMGTGMLSAPHEYA